MRRIVRLTLVAAGLAAFVALPAAGQAADMRMPVYKAAPCVSCDWNGFYAGGNVGVGMATSTTAESWNWVNTIPTGTLIGIGGGPLFTTAAPTPFSTTFTNQYHHDGRGILGGLQAGYNWQIGRVVIGAEGDWSWTKQNDTASYGAQPLPGIFPPLPSFFFIPASAQGWTSEQRLDWVSTARGRLGWAQGTNLWYVTGGAAWARIENKYTLVSSPGNTGLLLASGPNGPGSFAQFGLPGGGQAANFSTVKMGWALGGGVETAIGELLGLGGGNRWTMKLEYLYVNLGNVNYQFGTNQTPVCGTTCVAPFLITGTAAFSSQNHVYEQIVRVGLNYKFDTTIAPPVARRY
jgi:outer membrane immunogenic protein